MTKRYCDICGNETAVNYVEARLTGQQKHRPLVIEFGVDACIVDKTGADLCKYCVIDAVKGLDDRPRATVAQKGSQ